MLEDMKTDATGHSPNPAKINRTINSKRLKIVLILIGLFCVGSFSTYLVMQKAQERVLRMEQANRLKNLGLALRVATTDNSSQNWEDFIRGIPTNNIIDPISNKPFVIVNTNKYLSELAHFPSRVLAYPPDVEKTGGNCLLTDGSVHSFAVFVALDK